MSDSDDFSKVVANKLQPYAWLIGLTVSGVVWVANKTWDAAGEVRDIQDADKKQTKDIATCLASDRVHMEDLKRSELRHALALQAIFEHQVLIMDMATDRLSDKRKRAFTSRINVHRSDVLKLITSIPVPKEVVR